MRHTRKGGKYASRKSRKMRGGRINVQLNDEINRLYGNISKISEISEEQLFNAFNNKKKVGVDKKNIMTIFKMMKENVKEINTEANKVSKLVNANVKTNTSTLKQIMTMLKKAKNDVSNVPEKELEAAMNKWEVFDTHRGEDTWLVDDVMNRMITY